jgi:hypothetical protein
MARRQQPQGKRSGQGTSDLWNLVRQDEMQRKPPAEVPHPPTGETDPTAPAEGHRPARKHPQQ